MRVIRMIEGRYNEFWPVEECEGISETVPDQSMSIQEILNLYNSGQKVETKEPIFELSDTLNDEISSNLAPEDEPDELVGFLETAAEYEKSEKEKKRLLKEQRLRDAERAKAELQAKAKEPEVIKKE